MEEIFEHLWAVTWKPAGQIFKWGEECARETGSHVAGSNVGWRWSVMWLGVTSLAYLGNDPRCSDPGRRTVCMVLTDE